MRPRSSAPAKDGPYRVVYFGTPEFAVPALERLTALPEFDVRLVVTQPDRPSGRGRRMTGSPVKATAERLGVPVYQPGSLRTPALRGPIAAAAADLFVVAAYGVVFGQKTLGLPRIACVNIHASLLPAYRGASPISAAILSGDRDAGVSLMVMEAGLDTGPVIAQASLPIGPGATTASLTVRLAELGAGMMQTALPAFAEGRLGPVPQPSDGVSLTRPLVKADGWLDWRRSGSDLERQIRAMWPWPRAWTTHLGEPLQIHQGAASPEHAEAGDGQAPGALVRLGADIAVVCGTGMLVLDVVQPAGGKPMRAMSLLARSGVPGPVVLGATGSPILPPVPPVVAVS